MNRQSFIFIGRSGCGKGTQSRLIGEYLEKIDPSRKAFYVQSGEEFRRFIQGDSYTKRLSKKIYEDGGLEPEFLAILMWANFLSENYNGKDHVIVDGTPREIHEAGVLHSIFDFYKLEKPRVVYINISEEEAEKRLLSRGRQDDNQRDIKARLKWFNTDVIPTIDFYRNNSFYQLVEVNGEKDIEEVHKEIIERTGL